MKTFFNVNGAAVVLAGLCVLLSAGVGNAGVLNPEFDDFGSLPAATFGGSGIPNNAVAITTISNSGKTITLGLTATQRYSNPPVTNNGAGVFSAELGEDSSNAGYARWNFNYYINVTPGAAGDYRYRLFYDMDPGVGTSDDELGVINIPSLSALQYQNSLNLGFGYLSTGTGIFGVSEPTYNSFNPNASGQYTFSLVAYEKVGGFGYGEELGRSTIIVNTVPEPATLAMFSLLAIGAAGAYRRRKSRVAVC
mgnify:CR=1 FL=1|tara:strand:- start:133 stop:885 length:753 start_codon:yes stop_codon:yes gene_type:complete